MINLLFVKVQKSQYDSKMIIGVDKFESQYSIPHLDVQHVPAFDAYNPAYQAPNPVYQAPNPVYKAPNPVYQTPNPVYQASSQIYQAPNPIYQAPNPVYQAPSPVNEAQPNSIYNSEAHRKIPATWNK